MSIVTEQVAVVATSPSTTAVETSENKIPSINLEAINANVTVQVADPPQRAKATIVTQPTFNYTPVLSVERACADDEQLVAQPRAHYVAEFKRGAEKTARATLETSRTVYEASRMLDSYEFNNFCREIGYRDTSSSIRKLIAIGKVYPRFIQYADQMPSGWTAIYQITQIPADTFEHMLSKGQPLNELKGKNLVALLGKTKKLDDLESAAKFDSAAGGFIFAKVVAVRPFDDIDWRAIEKGMNELQARLPVKFVVPHDITKLVAERRLRKYDSAKKAFTHQEFKPETWDLGEEANAVLPRPQGKPVAPKK